MPALAPSPSVNAVQLAIPSTVTVKPPPTTTLSVAVGTTPPDHVAVELQLPLCAALICAFVAMPIVQTSTNESSALVNVFFIGVCIICLWYMVIENRF